ncbi:MAG: PAS domain S-box protein [Cyclobacteriaceae bacterium]
MNNNLLFASLLILLGTGLMALAAKLIFKRSILFNMAVIPTSLVGIITLLFFILGKPDSVANLWILIIFLGGLSCFYYYLHKRMHPLFAELVESAKRVSLEKESTSAKSLENRQDEIGEISRSFLSLHSSIIEASQFINEISAGNLDASLPEENENNVLSVALSNMTDSLKETLEETHYVVKSAGDEGNLDERIDLSEKSGLWLHFSQNINSLLDSISKPFTAINHIVTAMAAGDLTLRYTDQSEGEIGKMTTNLNLALDNIEGLLHQISENIKIIDESATEMKVSGNEMNSNTNEIASAIAEMSNGAQNQVSKVDESSSLMEAILQDSKKMVEKSEAINEAAKLGARSSENGMKLVGNVVTSMREISEYSNKTDSSMKVLSERSNEISKALSVITEIASQTNLLALNAAIEAAQAGEYGRGFAVVAEEIRKLAEGSRESAREVETLVHAVQTDTSEAVSVMEQMKKVVKGGEETSQTASASFKEILDSSNSTLNFSEDILSSAKNQIDSINNVVTITESVVVIAEETAAGTEEVASSATELSSGMNGYNEKAQNLAEVAEKFNESISMVKLSGQTSENNALFKIREAFETERSLLDSLLNHMPDFIYFKDLKGNFTRVSKSMTSIFNVKSAKSIIGKSDFDFFGEHAKKAYEDEQRIINTDKPLLNLVEKEDRKDGSTAYVSTTKLPLKDKEGKIIGTFGISRDITELKLAEIKSGNQTMELEKLKKRIADSNGDNSLIDLSDDQKQFYNQILNEIQDQVGVQAADGTVYFINESMASKLGSSPSDLIGKQKIIGQKIDLDQIKNRKIATSLSKTEESKNFKLEHKAPVVIPELNDWGLITVQTEIAPSRAEDKTFISELKEKFPHIVLSID